MVALVYHPGLRRDSLKITPEPPHHPTLRLEVDDGGGSGTQICPGLVSPRWSGSQPQPIEAEILGTFVPVLKP